MLKRKGSMLEERAASLFERAGFDTKNNRWIEGYEIDVLAKKGDYKIIIECKQNENSRINLRNLIHQWVSKNSIIKANKVVLVLVGQVPNRNEYNLAESFGISIIDGNKMDHLDSLNEEKLIDELNDIICFDEEAYRIKQKKKLIREIIIVGCIILISIIAMFLLHLN